MTSSWFEEGANRITVEITGFSATPGFREAIREMIGSMIPSPPSAIDPMKAWVARLETLVEQLRQAGGEDHRKWCDCFPCNAARVLASKPKEGPPDA